MAAQLSERVGRAQAELASSAINAEDLRKTYGNGVEALSGVSFTVQPGEIFGLLSPNGAGFSAISNGVARLHAARRR